MVIAEATPSLEIEFVFLIRLSLTAGDLRSVEMLQLHELIPSDISPTHLTMINERVNVCSCQVINGKRACKNIDLVI